MNKLTWRLTYGWLWRVRRWLGAYRHPFSILTGHGKVGMDDLRRALAPALVERGRDNSVLVIVFTGMGGGFVGMPVYEFFDATKSLGYSRILLRDQYHRHYHRGIDKQRPDFPSLISYLREEIERLGPKKVLCTGTSAGGYAAIRAGHELRADYVHAFGPVTGHDKKRRRLSRDSYTDLVELLKERNQNTIYYIHYCRGYEPDRDSAEWLSRSSGVVSIGYPCNSHQVAVFLTKKGFLTEALAIANQHRVEEIAKAYFRDDVELNERRAEIASGRPQ